ncbi:hypothetical protein A3C23_03250 [Candidatus Roizmanbacteria bacterium RIFCSPHIGHO2_02_FULL_37_13b]|uniref:Fido domain-containing protein n=1 Tax=Candidatus Roizmanbacteria bacterium RIFCSPLOWO2_02_FULL_36_11 TaxID=1802071 RepID=A0A1F7JGI6_9BACT|nr:MAG: hypothetical protein A3C23_03250 [Candidatus Roizmanbacteria bacterium RIFCSPHIGHO2_02_FULL_37_13b]OGK54724.1 MAG: hypothetical protein A3H78_05530 [Candidatus Roizmanbacteria bacterium RIFCSPLOWO2_02_FULL_36_11]
MFNITLLTLTDFEIICSELKDFFKKNKDPLPNFQESYFDKLESVIATPRRTFNKKDLYPGLFEKASCYLYFINKLHPFSNANKRISIVATGVFLMYNRHEFTSDENLMYEFAKKITLSQKDQKTEFNEVVAFIRKHTKKITLFKKQPFIFEILKFLQRVRVPKYR